VAHILQARWPHACTYDDFYFVLYKCALIIIITAITTTAAAVIMLTPNTNKAIHGKVNIEQKYHWQNGSIY